MRPPPHRAPAFWKWFLISSQLVLVAWIGVMFCLGRDVRQLSGVGLGIGAAASMCLLFLLFGGPFLVRSHRWLAILGWGIAVAAIFLSTAK